METQQIWANLAVADLSRTAKFYTALGFERNGKASEELVSFFFSGNKFVIHFFDRTKIERSTGTNFSTSHTSSEVMFSLSTTAEAEVSKWMEQAIQAGGSVFRAASRDEQGFFWGGFADPDGHRFNVLLIEPGM